MYMTRASSVILLAVSIGCTGQSAKWHLTQDEASTLWSSAKSTSEPVYPALARISRLEGALIVDLDVDSTGKVQSALLVEGPKQFMGEVTRYTGRLRFPPMADSSSSIRVVRLFIQFQIKPSGSSTSGSIGVGVVPTEMTTYQVQPSVVCY